MLGPHEMYWRCREIERGPRWVGGSVGRMAGCGCGRRSHDGKTAPIFRVVPECGAQWADPSHPNHSAVVLPLCVVCNWLFAVFWPFGSCLEVVAQRSEHRRRR